MHFVLLKYLNNYLTWDIICNKLLNLNVDKDHWFYFKGIEIINPFYAGGDFWNLCFK